MKIRLADNTELQATNIYKNYNKGNNAWILTMILPVSDALEQEIVDKLTPANLSTVSVLDDGALTDSITGYDDIQNIQISYDNRGKIISVTSSKAT